MGIYGVVAHAVSLRRREIGVRMALGAGTRAVLATVAGALALSRLLAGQLFEVPPTDPVQLAGAPLLLGAVALLACYLPAHRALRVDPAITLRAE